MPRKLKDERGQAAIFMALFISTMILLFAFTTNVGMLVHAKINLQNAADAAAYAGAAVQARQLTNAAYLNWEMRRAVKEFLFYMTVRGQMKAMPCYPLNSNGDTLQSPFPCPQRPGNERYKFAFYDPRENNNESTPGGSFGYLPTICIIFDVNNNYCQKAGVPGIPEFPSGGGWGVADPIVAAVRNATNQIISKKIQDCEGRTEINQKFLIAWLFNFYPVKDPTSLLSTGSDADDPFPFNQGMERLGVLPRMAMLRARVDNIEESLNMNLANEGVGSPTISGETMGTLRSAGKPLDYFERPIQAYLSAINNLPLVNENNGNFAEVELTELIPNRPGSVDANPNLKNPPVLVKFNDLTERAMFANSLFKQIVGGDRGNCYQFREQRVIPAFPLGIVKDPNIITYYAVRLQAKARLLFSPFGGNGVVTLQAYSAAKPFGSRIGKDLNPERTTDGSLKMAMALALLGRGYTDVGGGGINAGEDFVNTLTSPVFPNVLVEDGDNDSNVHGFTTNAHLGYLRAGVVRTSRLDYGPRLAGAYAPWEVGYYTPPANFNEPDIIGKFEDNPNYAGEKFFTLTAPIFPVNGTGGDDLSFIRDRVKRYLQGGVADSLTLSAKFNELLEAVMGEDRFSAMIGYMNNSLETKFHYIPDPMLADEPLLVQYINESGGERFTVAGMQDSFKRQLTSWNTQKTSADGAGLDVETNSELGPDMGRSGYSVRFMSFSALKAGGTTSNDPLLSGIQWTNPFDRFDTGTNAARISNDLNNLKH